MRKFVAISLAGIAAAPLASAPAFAQDTQQQQQTTTKKVPDPNEVVCEKQQETGSRLASERVCMTRSQWAEQRRVARQEIDRAQTERGMNTPH
ncbi:MAG TPA: hypothetical protein VFW39_12055 [Sphingomicrobium sp.]|nr:hypothetical protein [Sphingomicrobium sp.]